MRRHGNKRHSGFSLLESLVGLGIIAIVLGMSIVGFGYMWPSFKANSAMDQVLYRLRAAREQAIAHRHNVQVQFVGTNQITITELWAAGTPPPPVTVSFEGGAQFTVYNTLPDTPMAYGNTSAIYFEGVSGGPPIMQFTTSGTFVDGGNTLVNGTVFLGLPGNPASARAVTVLGGTGRVREYLWDGTQWQE
jgi:prepilin-type N-terminal cleavage/methylation domain-containing protein